MAAKEPSYWAKWAAGIVATVVAGVLVAVLAGAFDPDPSEPDPPTTPPPSARVRISQFSTARGQAGQYPAATFKVYNGGDDTADRCIIEWDPFGDNLDTETLGSKEFSEEFAVEPKTSYTLSLRGSTPYPRGAGPYTAARVKCENATSDVDTDFIVIF